MGVRWLWESGECTVVFGVVSGLKEGFEIQGLGSMFFLLQSDLRHVHKVACFQCGLRKVSLLACFF